MPDGNKLVNLADLKTAIDVTVRHDAVQSLNANAQSQVRANVGAASPEGVKHATGVEPIEFRRGYGISTSGTTVDVTALTPSTSGYACAVVDCVPGDTFTLSGKGGSGLRLWCFIDSNGNALDPRSAANATADHAVITAPANAAKLVINSNFVNAPGTFAIKGRNISEQLDDIRTLAGIADDSGVLDFVHGYAINTSGATVDITSPTVSTTGYMYAVADCTEGDVFTISGSAGINMRLWCFIDASGNAIDPRAPASATLNGGMITAPANAAKLVVNCNSSAGWAVRGQVIAKRIWWPARKWYVIGDSISYGSYSSSGGLQRDPTIAWPVVTASLLGYKLTNYAVPGMGFLQVAGMPPGSDDDLLDVLNESYTGAELVTVMLGTNDYGHDKTLGTIADASSVASIYGRIKKIVETMQTKCPAARLIFITPIPRATAGSAATQYCKNTANGAGYTLNDVKNAVIESCEYYGIEYINLQDTSPLNYANKGTYLLDNLHPTIDGHKRLGEWMASRLTF